MANDITGADHRCPNCNMWLNVGVVGNTCFLWCHCGYGRDEYFKALLDFYNTIDDETITNEKETPKLKKTIFKNIFHKWKEK